MLQILRKARSTTRTLHPWSNPTIISHHVAAILSEYKTGFRVETGTFSSWYSSSPPPQATVEDHQPQPHINNTTADKNETVTKLSGKKERNTAFQDFKRNLVRGQPSAAAAALDEYHKAGGPPSRPMIHSLMDLYSRKGDADSVVKLLHIMIDSLNPPPNQHSFGYAISALKISGGGGFRATTSADADVVDNPNNPRLSAALQALNLFETMIANKQLNLLPNSTLYNELIDCFGKAGGVDQAFKLFHRSVTIDNIKPTAHTFSILIKACAVAKQPDRANDVVFKLMPQHEMVPTAAAWNGLLGAAAAAAGGSVDRAYEVWQKMIDAGVEPDMHTERALAKAFASHPQFAAELVGEARTLAEENKNKILIREKKKQMEKETALEAKKSILSKARSREEKISEKERSSLSLIDTKDTILSSALPSPSPSPVSAAFPSAPSKQQPILLDELQRKKQQSISAHALGLAPDLASSFSRQRQQLLWQEEAGNEEKYESLYDTIINQPKSFKDVSKLLSLDLHGHSQAAAEMTLLCRLEALVEAWPEISKIAQQAQREESTTSKDLKSEIEGLVIITGVGKGSRDGVGVLKRAVRAVLNKQGLSAHDVPNNSGRLFVPWIDISNFAEEQRERMQRDHFYAAARARYATVGVGIAGVVAAAVLIPRLGPWLI